MADSNEMPRNVAEGVDSYLYFTRLKGVSGSGSQYSDFLNNKKTLTEFKRRYGHFPLDMSTLEAVAKDFTNDPYPPTVESRRRALYKLYTWFYECKILTSIITI